jgi:lipoprotein NlpI
METSFLEKLLAFYKAEPDDPFNAYALALEYQKYDSSKASSLFEELLHSHPDYLPTYYHAAQFFGDLADAELVRNIYTKGIELAAIQQNTRAQQELSRAFRTFEEEQMEW